MQYNKIDVLVSVGCGRPEGRKSGIIDNQYLNSWIGTIFFYWLLFSPLSLSFSLLLNWTSPHCFKFQMVGEKIQQELLDICPKPLQPPLDGNAARFHFVIVVSVERNGNVQFPRCSQWHKFASIRFNSNGVSLIFATQLPPFFTKTNSTWFEWNSISGFMCFIHLSCVNMLHQNAFLRRAAMASIRSPTALNKVFDNLINLEQVLAVDLLKLKWIPI